MKHNRTINDLMVLMLFVLGAFFTACASKPPQAGISSSANPQQEISKVSERLDNAKTKNIDVLAADEFKKSAKAFDQAKTDLAKGKDQEKILDSVRYSNIYLNDAYAKAQNRAEKAPGLFEARQAAITAGAMNQTELRNEWESLDKDVASEAHRLDKLSANQITKYQERYVDLERKAVIGAQVGSAKAQINGARKDGAARKAPQTLKKAELSLANAETVISANVRNATEYRSAVNTAKADAKLLSDVMATISANGKDLSESAALAMVEQKRQIAGLRSDLQTAEAEVAGVEGQLSAREQTLAEQRRALLAQGAVLAEKDGELKSAQSSVALQQAIEEARSKFSPNEAEAYQQGQSLLIRLKSVNFASGKADLPEQSKPLLEKVSEVAKGLNAKEIKVEGHTDSVGTAAVNKTLSEQRASAVATYLKSGELAQADIESEGVGFEKPIASNKSKEGRAQNRRVDIIITPATSNGSTVE